MRMPAPRRRSTNSEDDAAPAPPDRGGRPQLRPQLLRSMTWRASAPQLPGLDAIVAYETLKDELALWQARQHPTPSTQHLAPLVAEGFLRELYVAVKSMCTGG